jgi:hypothetical protein
MEYYYRNNNDSKWSCPISEIEISKYKEHQISVPVYNYSAQDYVLDTLQQKKLKLTAPSKLNDPFEFLFAQNKMSDKEVLERIRSFPYISQEQKQILETSPEKRAIVAENWYLPVNYINEMMDSNNRIRSFTQYHEKPNKYEILLWTHYTNNHTGVRICYLWDVEFNVNGEIQGNCYFLEDVRYTDERITLSADFNKLPLKVRGSLISKNATTKASAWQYEDEVRLITLPKFNYLAEQKTNCGLSIMEYQIIEENDLTFLRFQPQNIFSIDFGCRCPDDFKNKILTEVKANYPHVIVREAVLPRNGYNLEYIKIFPE